MFSYVHNTERKSDLVYLHEIMLIFHVDYQIKPNMEK
jgi:hypothetical protein